MGKSGPSPGLFKCVRRRRQEVLKGHGFSRAVRRAENVGLQPLRELALGAQTEVPQWLKPSQRQQLYGTAEAVPLQIIRA
jgi:hypothetical protein